MTASSRMLATVGLGRRPSPLGCPQPTRPNALWATAAKAWGVVDNADHDRLVMCPADRASVVCRPCAGAACRRWFKFSASWIGSEPHRRASRVFDPVAVDHRGHVADARAGYQGQVFSVVLCRGSPLDASLRL